VFNTKQKAMINVYPIRYKNDDIEFLMIKRATLSYNWQCVSSSVGDTMGALDHPKNETPLECAKRELFEETGYTPALVFSVNIPPESYIVTKNDEGEMSPPHLQKLMKEIKFYNFIAHIDQTQDPILNPLEHTDWKWCDFESAYKLIMWAVEKKLFKAINYFLSKNPLNH
jgi:8-oxo-dGTP pyrophosphatase MutT (NUDIX family)